MMNDHPGHSHHADQGQIILPKCPTPKTVGGSPLGWSIKGRLLWAALATALLWLSVAWAMGRLP